jgi:lipid-A-disaccharide synthase
MRVLFSAGEASGDAYAAGLAARLPAGTEIQAVGGPRAREAGATIVADSSDWGAVGILESLKVVPRVWGGYRAALRALAAGRPGVFVPIDFGYINVRLARAAKRAGWKVLYFVPPGSWRRDKQGADLPSVTDLIVTPFPWSAEILRGMGADARFLGHPLKETVAQTPDPVERAGIAVLPGSRAHEVRENLRAIVPAIEGLSGPVRLVVARNLGESALTRAWSAAGGGPAEFVTDGACAALKASRAAVVCSGTATLEAALCQCPCVVVYRGSRAMEIEYRIRRPKFEHISLPNILLRRALLPELIQWDATPARIRAEITSLAEDGPARKAQLDGFAELDATLGPSDALTQAAALISGLAQAQS